MARGVFRGLLLGVGGEGDRASLHRANDGEEEASTDSLLPPPQGKRGSVEEDPCPLSPRRETRGRGGGSPPNGRVTYLV